MTDSVSSSQTRSRGVQVRNQIFVIILVALLLYFVVSYISLVLEHTAMREDISQAAIDLQVVKDLGLRLERQLQYVRTDAYRETVARERLGMARDGDQVVAIIFDGSMPTEPSFFVSGPNLVDIRDLPIWQQWMALFNLETDLESVAVQP